MDIYEIRQTNCAETPTILGASFGLFETLDKAHKFLKKIKYISYEVNIAQSMEMKQSFDDLIYDSGATRKELELDGNTFLFYLPWRPSGDADFIPTELNYFTAIIKREVG